MLWDRIVGDEKASVINIEDMDSQRTQDLDEMEVYKTINEIFGISPVRLSERPQNMYLEKYEIDEEQRYAVLFYNYYDEVIKYSIYLNDSDSSFGQREPDELTDQYEIDNNGVNIIINEYSIENKDRKRYIAEFSYRDVNYQLKGVMEKAEFDKIIKNLDFL